MLLSFTIPCYRSEKTVEAVIREIVATVSARREYDFEIIAVNDCSPDGTWEVLKRVSREVPQLKVIDLAHNVGKHGALMAAFSVASGDVMIGVDDDGQCPLENLWRLLEPLEQGYDISMASYPKKEQSMVKNWGSSFNDLMVRTLIGKPKGMVFSNFIARKRFVCQELLRNKNPYPYLEGMTLKITTRIAQVPMEERKRQAGRSGYTLKKSIALLVNGCTAFSVKPLRLAMIFGVLFVLLGLVGGIAALIGTITVGAVNTTAVLVPVNSIIGGIVMMLLGIIGEYVGRIYICLNNLPQYVIREVYPPCAGTETSFFRKIPEQFR